MSPRSRLAPTPLIALLVLAMMATPAVAPLPAILEQGAVLDARGALWDDQADNRHQGITGEGVLGYNHELANRHPDLEACLARGGASPIQFNGVGLHPRVTNPQTGHGTRTAGVLCGDGTQSNLHGQSPPVTGVAPGMGLVTRSVTCEQIGLGGYTAGPCNWLAELDVRVFSFSIGAGPSPMDRAEARGAAPDADILFSSGAGNSGGDGAEAETVAWTGSDPRLLVAAAANGDASDVASYSSRGAIDDPTTWPDITAPACMFTTSFHAIGLDGLTLGFGLADDCPTVDPIVMAANNGFGYRFGGGTSFAAPFIAGVAAMMFEVNPGLHAEEAAALVKHTADPFIPAPDLDGDGTISPTEFRAEHGYKAGYGLVNATEAVAAAHYMLIHPAAAPSEAVDCSTTGQADDGRLVLNPRDGCR